MQELARSNQAATEPLFQHKAKQPQYLRRRTVPPEREPPVRVVHGNVMELVGGAYRRLVRKLLNLARLSLVCRESPDSRGREREAAEGGAARGCETVAEEK